MTEEPHRVVSHDPETPSMPRWVPTTIGVVLVAMAGLAVYTGIRYRTPTLSNGPVKSRRPARAATGVGAPGEPEPGSSLVFPGDAADNTPAAREPVPGHARAEITGTGHGITATSRLWARRGMITKVVPDDAMIAVNDLVIGQARQFDTMDEVYDFPAPGSYTIHISAPGYKDQQFVVTVAENAEDEIARLNVKLLR
jgi:hypothetical protein